MTKIDRKRERNFLRKHKYTKMISSNITITKLHRYGQTMVEEEEDKNARSFYVISRPNIPNKHIIKFGQIDI